MAQIDYTRMRTLGDRYADFRQVTEDALVFAAEKLGLDLDDEKRAALMAQYEELTAYPGGRASVLRPQGQGPAPRHPVERHAGSVRKAGAAMPGSTDCSITCLSVDSVKRYKPTPEAYPIGPDAFGCPASEIVFVSSNGWDACGATWYGYRTFWVNRAGNPLDKLGVRPAGEGRNLRDLLAYLRHLTARSRPASITCEAPRREQA